MEPPRRGVRRGAGRRLARDAGATTSAKKQQARASLPERASKLARGWRWKAVSEYLRAWVDLEPSDDTVRELLSMIDGTRDEVTHDVD